MNSFSVQFINEEIVKDREFAQGSITIGDFCENFRSSLSYWSINDYVNQWKDALSRTINNRLNSCLVTSMYDPHTANFIFWWILYPVNDIIHIQNHVLLLEESRLVFSIKNLYNFIPERTIFDQDGNKLSEWHIMAKDIEIFYHRLLSNNP